MIAQRERESGSFAASRSRGDSATVTCTRYMQHINEHAYTNKVPTIKWKSGIRYNLLDEPTVLLNINESYGHAVIG